VIFLLSSAIFPQEDIKIISSTATSLVLEFTPKYTPITEVANGGEHFKKITFENAVIENSDRFGSPEVLSRHIEIGVPTELGTTIQLLDYRYEEKDGQMLPVATPKKNNGFVDLIYVKGQDFSHKVEIDPVTLGSFSYFRSFPVQTIIVNPVQYFPAENKIRMYTSLKVKINFAPVSVSKQIVEDDLAKDVLLNYGVAKRWQREQKNLKKMTLQSSVLATGKWIRFEAPSEGIYKISKQMLSSFGIDAAKVDPRTIKIYSNGGEPLPEFPEAIHPDDLVENAIIVSGETDGKFDDGDYILFYGRGTDFWETDASGVKVMRSYNPYSKQNYFWITSGGQSGKRMVEQASLNASSPVVKTQTSAFVFHEDDKVNIGKSGRNFVGDEFTESIKSRSYTTPLDGLIPGSKVSYSSQFVNGSNSYVSLKVEESNTTVYTKTLYPEGDYSYGTLDRGKFSFTGTIPEKRSVLKFTYTPPDFGSTGYLDFFEINYQRDLAYSAEKLIFYSDLTPGTVEYHLSNFSSTDIYVFNVSNTSNVSRITQPVMQSGGEFRFQAQESGAYISKYLACLGTDYKTPINPVEMKNQDLHGTDGKSKFIIITPTEFKDQALRLKNYRENEAKVKISTTVIDVNDIFNEFSCGMLDPSAIRNFLRYAYDNWSVRPEYVLLFGHGNYDYKNIEGTNSNYLIPFETTEFLSEIYSYTSDDYFATIIGNDTTPDLCLGRLPVKNVSEATVVVDKIKEYESNTERGEWHNLITFVADDGKKTDGDDGSLHTDQSETLANDTVPQSYDEKKIYLVAYPTVITGLGRRKPDVNQAIIDAINQGTLLLNFIGHGNPEVWTHEQVFVQSVTIPQLKNKDYFFLTAATCDFGNWDKTSGQSSAEELVLKENAGAIGSISSVRPVYSDQNAAMNQKFYRSLLYTPKDSLSLPISIGKAYLLTKAVYHDVNSLKFHLFCDPTIRLQFPQDAARIDSINHLTSDTVRQVKALGNLSLSGSVRNADNSVNGNFNGEGILTVYDSKREVAFPEFGPGIHAVMPGGIIFRGRVSVVNGRFNANIVVPKDISYENKNGKIIFYFYNNQVDGVAATTNLIVGGTDSVLTNDGKGPDIQISFDNLQNTDGYLVNKNSTLLVKLSDETGLNTTGSGVGHKLEAVLNDNDAASIDLSTYFTGDLDAQGKSGEVQYKFNNLETGEQKILVKAWDVFNNFSSQVEYFKVVDETGNAVDYVMNYPNPSKGATTFTFQHNFASPISVKVKIYSIAGRVIAELEKPLVSNDRFVRIPWDGRDQDGNEIGNGVYLYKIIVNAIDGTASQSVAGKLAIVR